MADFQDCLSSVHERVAFTRENEEARSIAFLDVFVTREEDGKLSTRIYRKPSNTNLTMKPQSCQNPQTAVSSFKSELCRSYRLCSSLDQTKKEIDFIINMYEDNGHDRDSLLKIASAYRPPTEQTHTKTKTKRNVQTTTSQEREIKSLFDLLPFKNAPLVDNDEERKKFACITYIPGISHQLRRSLKKAGISTTFTSAPKLKDILCSRNKSKPEPTKKKGVYKYQCPCNPSSTYKGQTARAYDLRWEEHGRAIQNNQWAHSGISQHYQHCQKQFDKNNFEIITNAQDKNKKRLTYNIKIREALEIRRHGSGPGRGLNEDMGSYVKTDIWDPVLHSIGS